MKTNKIIGLILLFLGLLIILYPLYQSYNIFTAKTAAPQIFKITAPIAPVVETPKKTIDLQQEMGKALGEQFQKLMPSDFLPKIMNLVSWSIFVSLFLLGGSKISTLGIKLLKS